MGDVLSMPENLAAAATAAAAEEAARAVDPPLPLVLLSDPLGEADTPLFMVMEEGGPPIVGGMDL